MVNVPKIPELECLRCGHTWIPRGTKVFVCPGCHSPKWNEPPDGKKKRGG